MSDSVRFVFPAEGTGSQPVKCTWPCKVSVPLDGGSRQDQLVDVRFNVLDQGATLAAYRTGGDLGLFDAVVDSFPTFERQGGGKVEKGDAILFFRCRPFAVKGFLEGYWEVLGLRQPKN
jgi:hypothetical protein